MKRSPILGYNHNVRYAGRLWHIQTEDSGVSNPHIFTHLFHEGTILATKRGDYDPSLEVPAVQKLMQAQHKQLLRELKDGAFDEKIERFFGRPITKDETGEAVVAPQESPPPELPPPAPPPVDFGRASTLLATDGVSLVPGADSAAGADPVTAAPTPLPGPMTDPSMPAVELPIAEPTDFDATAAADDDDGPEITVEQPAAAAPRPVVPEKTPIAPIPIPPVPSVPRTPSLSGMRAVPAIPPTRSTTGSTPVVPGRSPTGSTPVVPPTRPSGTTPAVSARSPSGSTPVVPARPSSGSTPVVPGRSPSGTTPTVAPRTTTPQGNRVPARTPTPVSGNPRVPSTSPAGGVPRSPTPQKNPVVVPGQGVKSVPPADDPLSQIPLFAAPAAGPPPQQPSGTPPRRDATPLRVPTRPAQPAARDLPPPQRRSATDHPVQRRNSQTHGIVKPTSEGVVVARPAVVIGGNAPPAAAPRAGQAPPQRQVPQRWHTGSNQPAPQDPRTGKPFGSDLISERSLDEVILAYLSEDAKEK